MSRRDVDPGTANLVRALGRRIRSLEAGQLRNIRASQAAHRSIEAGGSKVYDETGNLRTIVGALEDGTYAVQMYGGEAPPIPSAPVITYGAGAVTIAWDGYDENDELGWPADFDRVEVHLAEDPDIVPDDDNQLTSFNSPIGGSTTLVLDPGATRFIVFTSVSKSGLESGPSYEMEVVGPAVEPNPGTNPGGSGNTPSLPIITSKLGVLKVAWGGTTDPNHAYLEIHYSTNPLFVPVKGGATLLETLYGKAPGYGLLVASGTYGVTYYFRFIAVDKWGNASPASPVASGSVTPLVNTDIIGQVIAGANIVSGSVNAADVIIGNTITGALIQALAITAGKLGANAVTADKIDAGAITAVKIAAGAITADKLDVNALTGKLIQTATSGGRVVMGPGFGGSVLLYDNAGNYAGVVDAQSANHIALRGADGNGIIVGGGGAQLTGPLEMQGHSLTGVLNITALGVAHLQDIYSDRHDDGSGTTTASIGGQGRILRTGESSRRLKENDQPLALASAKRILELSDVTFNYRDRATYGDGRYAGWFLDDAVNAGLEELINRSGEGEARQLRYEHAVVHHNVLLRDIYERLADLEEAR